VGGQSLRFALSQSLFSSHDIDRGSRLLLKAVCRRLPAASFGSVLDMGCGVGVLGLSLKKLYPQADLYLSDRDALALGFAGLNAGTNRLEPVRFGGHLGFAGLEGEDFDLIVSNLPAKAGPPVLRHFLDTFSACLKPGGLFVLVIVNTLEELVASGLREIVFRERGGEHTVFCCRRQAASGPGDLAPYIRGRFSFSARGRSYSLETVYNLPDFDTLGHETMAMLELLERFPARGRTLIWNPGQGHIPLAVDGASLTLGSRDLLQLAVSARNLGEQQPDCLHLPDPGWIEDSFETVIVFPDAEPAAAELLARTCPGLLEPGGRLYLVAPSTQAQRLLAARCGLRLIKSRKAKGVRALLLAAKK
jgi:SAM-dependent methyltransferase